MDTEKISGIIADLEYSKYDAVMRLDSIDVNPLRKEIVLKGFFNQYQNSGTCAELMNTAYVRLREAFPKTHIFRVEGLEPRYFHKIPSKHCFLIMSKENKPDYPVITLDENTIERTLDERMILIDPSFKIVAPFFGSGYSAQKMFGHNCYVHYPNNCTIENNKGIPLGFSAELGQMVHLMSDFRFAESIAIGLQEEKRCVTVYSLESPHLDEMLKADEKISQMVEKLKRTRRKKRILTLPNIPWINPEKETIV